MTSVGSDMMVAVQGGMRRYDSRENTYAVTCGMRTFQGASRLPFGATVWVLTDISEQCTFLFVCAFTFITYSNSTTQRLPASIIICLVLLYRAAIC
jgi:hypothetical protein